MDVQAGLCLSCSQTPEDRIFLRRGTYNILSFVTLIVDKLIYRFSHPYIETTGKIPVENQYVYFCVH